MSHEGGRKVRFDSFRLVASKERELFPNEVPMWKRTLDILFILAVLPVADLGPDGRWRRRVIST